MVWNFAETHSVRRVSGELPKTLGKLCVSKNFHTKKSCEITVFYASCVKNWTLKESFFININVNFHNHYRTGKYVNFVLV